MQSGGTIWVEPSRENAAKVFQALQSFDAPLQGLAEANFAEDGFYQMGRPPVRVDVLMPVDGVRFQDAWENRVETNFDETPAHMIGLSDLIANKKIGGRPQDLIDIESMTLSQQVNGKIKQETTSRKENEQDNER